MLGNSCLAQHTFCQNSVNKDERPCGLFLNSIEFSAHKSPGVRVDQELSHGASFIFLLCHQCPRTWTKCGSRLGRSFLIDPSDVGVDSSVCQVCVFLRRSRHVSFHISDAIPRPMVIWKELMMVYGRPYHEQTQKDILEICLPEDEWKYPHMWLSRIKCTQESVPLLLWEKKFHFF